MIAQENAIWNQTTILKAFRTLVILLLDSKPKPRKRARNAIRNVVTFPPLIMLVHPGMKVVVQTALQILKEPGNGVVGAAASKDKDNAVQMILQTPTTACSYGRKSLAREVYATFPCTLGNVRR